MKRLQFNRRQEHDGPVFDVTWVPFGVVGTIAKRGNDWVVRSFVARGINYTVCGGPEHRTRRSALHKLLGQYVQVPFAELTDDLIDHPQNTR